MCTHCSAALAAKRLPQGVVKNGQIAPCTVSNGNTAPSSNTSYTDCTHYARSFRRLLPESSCTLTGNTTLSSFCDHAPWQLLLQRLKRAIKVVRSPSFADKAMSQHSEMKRSQL